MTFYYHQILDLAGLRHFNFHALRHTFATRAMEQGMDEKTLSTLLGHYSIAFTMDTYAHVLDTHKWEGINLMNDLYSAGQPSIRPQGYPILVTPKEDVDFVVTAPDFPEIQVTAPTMEGGVEQMQAAIRQALSGVACPPGSTPLYNVNAQPGQYVMEILV